MSLLLADKDIPEKNYTSNQIRLEELGLCTLSVKCKGQKTWLSRSMTLLEVLHMGTQPPTLCLATCITLAGNSWRFILYNAHFKWNINFIFSLSTNIYIYRYIYTEPIYQYNNKGQYNDSVYLYTMHWLNPPFHPTSFPIPVIPNSVSSQPILVPLYEKTCTILSYYLDDTFLLNSSS